MKSFSRLLRDLKATSQYAFYSHRRRNQPAENLFCRAYSTKSKSSPDLCHPCPILCKHHVERPQNSVRVQNISITCIKPVSEWTSLFPSFDGWTEFTSAFRFLRGC